MFDRSIALRLASAAMAFLVPLTTSASPTLYSEFQVPRLMELEDQWQKRIWISRTARILWKGYEIRDSRLFDRWMSMDEESVVLEMLADDRFVRTAIDFSYYYLGRKVSDTPFKWGNARAMEWLEQYPQVIHLAKQILAGEGDFFDFYADEIPFHLLRLREPTWLEPEGSEGLFADEKEPTTPRETRERIHQFYLRSYDAAANYITSKAEDFDHSEFCSDPTIYDFGGAFFYWLQFYGYSFIATISHSETINSIVHLEQFCAGNPNKLSSFEFLGHLTKLKTFLVSLHKETQDKFEFDVYQPRGIEQLKIGPKTLYPSGKVPAFLLGYTEYFNNNSTNFNRKRAAYMLDRFFCDDLTPVAIEDNGDHTDDRHGSQAACMACHYRLDPMAGFFRYNGVFFYNFKDENRIIFDDQAILPIQDYLQEWKNPAGHEREWNIGYVRSQNQEELNDYGESMADLTRILKTAPEVRACLVKRVFQYMTTSDQTFDGDYIEYITENFNEAAKTDSLQAYKDLFGTAALSSTYSQEERSPTECYDYRPGVDPANRPPCQVASILDSACVECHKSPGGKGNLNLDKWVEITPGVFSFEHFEDDFITPVPKAETMARIAERISSPNPRLRMPKGGGYMTAVDRKDLYLWALEHSESEGESE